MRWNNECVALIARAPHLKNEALAERQEAHVTKIKCMVLEDIREAQITKKPTTGVS